MSAVSVVSPAPIAHLLEGAPVLMEGRDARALLHRLLTLHARRLAAGEGGLAHLLDARGRALHTFALLCLGERWLLLPPAGGAAGLAAALDMYIFSEDARVAPSPWRGLRVELPAAGVAARAALTPLALTPLAPYLAAEPQGWAAGAQSAEEGVVGEGDAGEPDAGERGAWGAVEVGGAVWARAPRFGAFGVGGGAAERELWGPPELIEEVAGALRAAGVAVEGAAALESRRVRLGAPAAPREYQPRYCPLDVGLAGISEQKGCYPGQEVIERTIALGKPARALIRLRAVLPAGAGGEEGVGEGGVSEELAAQVAALAAGLEGEPAPLWAVSEGAAGEEPEGADASSGAGAPGAELTSLAWGEGGLYALALARRASAEEGLWRSACGLRFSLLTHERGEG